jgi:hypothetical protein
MKYRSSWFAMASMEGWYPRAGTLRPWVQNLVLLTPRLMRSPASLEPSRHNADLLFVLLSSMLKQRWDSRRRYSPFQGRGWELAASPQLNLGSSGCVVSDLFVFSSSGASNAWACESGVVARPARFVAFVFDVLDFFAGGIVWKIEPIPRMLYILVVRGSKLIYVKMEIVKSNDLKNLLKPRDGPVTL